MADLANVLPGQKHWTSSVGMIGLALAWALRSVEILEDNLPVAMDHDHHMVRSGAAHFAVTDGAAHAIQANRKQCAAAPCSSGICGTNA